MSAMWGRIQSPLPSCQIYFEWPGRLTIFPRLPYPYAGFARTRSPLRFFVEQAGRVNHLVERLVDLASDQLGIDRHTLRKRNLIRTNQLPYETALGLHYDSGDFHSNFQSALNLMDLDDLPARRADAELRGTCLGVGAVNYLESPGAAPFERTDVSVSAQRQIRAVIGTQSSGQGHETSFAQVLAEILEIPLKEVVVSFGDSDIAIEGSGTHADRSMRLGGTILKRAADRIIELGRQRAGDLLEAAGADLHYAKGRFTVVGTDRSVTLYEIAASAPLETTEEISTRLHAHPTGAAACEVEIDPQTGALTLTRYVTVDDVGTVVNPMIVEGQIHGGAAQGIGQAVLEQIVYDTSSGQLLSGSLMDYALPRASDLPSFSAQFNSCPASSNPLGIKGAGEAGTTAATAAILSAATDALKALGVKDLAMPLTPERIWQAIRSGKIVEQLNSRIQSVARQRLRVYENRRQHGRLATGIHPRVVSAALDDHVERLHGHFCVVQNQRDLSGQ